MLSAMCVCQHVEWATGNLLRIQVHVWDLWVWVNDVVHFWVRGDGVEQLRACRKTCASGSVKRRTRQGHQMYEEGLIRPRPTCNYHKECVGCLGGRLPCPQQRSAHAASANRG
jgi:hypothetical protein